MTALAALIRRDIRIALRVGGGALIGVLFFLTVTVLMPFAIGPDLALLTRLGPAILWLGALLASLLTLDRLFTADHEDGSLILLRQADLPLSAIVAAKLIAHWMVSGVPLIVASPLLAVMLAMELDAFWRTLLSLLLGTPALAAFGAIGAAVTVAIRRGGLIAPILIAPLSIPVLIFGVGSITSPQSSAALLFLAALSLMAVALAPFAAALAISSAED